jgi:hypothetical protein
MSHHYPGPSFAFPNGDARLNFTDMFAFPKPGDNSKSILVVDVHPSFGLNPSGPTPAAAFKPGALYEIMIDTDGDNVVNVAYSVRIAESPQGQTATLRRIDGTRSNRTGSEGTVIVDAWPVSTGQDAQVSTAGDYRFFAGWRSDPFFFDTEGAIAGLKFTGSDFFIAKNIASIVLELPNAAFGSTNVRLWSRTLDTASGRLVQTDRGAHASQEPFLVGDDEKVSYITGEPANDARFIPTFAHSLQHAGGYTPEEATRVAGTLLPDLMSYQPGIAASYPANGRALTDDAGGHFIRVLTNGKLTGDGLHPHTDFLADFPYLGHPHAA